MCAKYNSEMDETEIVVILLAFTDACNCLKLHDDHFYLAKMNKSYSIYFWKYLNPNLSAGPIAICFMFLSLLLSLPGFSQNLGDLSMNYSSTGDGIGRVSYVDNGNFNSGNGNIFSCGASALSNYNGANWTNPSGVSPKPFFPVNLLWPYNFTWYCSNSILSGHPAYNTSAFKGFLEINMLYNSGSGNRWNYFLMKLNAPLQEGVEYSLQADLAARILTPGANDLYLDKIGFALLDTLPPADSWDFLPGIDPDFETPDGQLINTQVFHIDQTVVGSGQQYLMVGLFKPMEEMAFSGVVDDNFNCKYILDNIWLYRPDCLNGATPSPHVYFTSTQDEELSCPDQNVTFDATSGFSPYTWTIDGQVQPGNLSYLSFLAGDQQHLITVSCDTGSCATIDTAYFLPRSIQLAMPEDTLFPCSNTLQLQQTAVLSNVITNSWNVEWSGINTGFTSSWSSDLASNPNVNVTFTQPDQYALHIGYYGNTCHYYDTIAVYAQQSLLTDSLLNPLIEPIIGTEHCVNMYDGYIAFNEEIYPLPLYYDWILPANIPDSVPAAMALTTGIYDVTVYDIEGRCNSFEPFVPQNLSSCSYISGEVKVDTVYNCVDTAAHYGNPNQMVIAMPIGNLAITDSLGHYSIPVPPGVYDVERVYYSSYWNSECQWNTTVNLPEQGMIANDVDFIDTIHVSTVDVNILSLNLSDVLVINEFSTLGCSIQNEGDTAIAVQAKILIGSPFLVPETAGVPEYTGMSGDTLFFEVGIIEPGASQNISLPLHILQNTDIIGDIVQMQAWLVPANDAQPDGNYKFFESMIMGAYDPNIKTVSPIGYTSQNYISNATTGIDYTIYFQNTGNYPATTVRIEDPLSDVFLPSTIQVTSSSHAMEVSYFDGMLQFLFNDIFLPDSSSDPEGSQGFVSYRIETQTGLQQGSLLENTGYIFFDANPPIVTNTATNTIFDCDAFEATFDAQWTPCSNEITCSFPTTWVEEQLWYYDNNLVSVEESTTISGETGYNLITHSISNPACGQRTDTVSVFIPENGIVEITSNSTYVCPTSPVLLTTEIEIGGYSWSLNGEPYGNAQTLATNQAGDYQLTIDYEECTLISDVITIDANPYDLNQNGSTDIMDLLVMIADFSCTSGCAADIDGDNIVGVQDIFLFIGNYDFPCGE